MQLLQSSMSATLSKADRPLHHEALALCSSHQLVELSKATLRKADRPLDLEVLVHGQQLVELAKATSKEVYPVYSSEAVELPVRCTLSPGLGSNLKRSRSRSAGHRPR